MRRTSICSLWTALCGVLVIASSTAAQDAGWRPASANGDRYGAAGGGGVRTADRGAPLQDITPIGTTSRSGSSSMPAGGGGNMTPINNGVQRARVTDKSATLPQTAGQVFREYDIRPYTLRQQNAAQPEQLIVDWILRETGYEAWHSEPMGVLSANRETLSIYHTPEMQAMCAEIVDRFVNARADQVAFSMRIATVRNPNWRAKALPLMTPIPVQSPGVQGWLLAKEDAALLASDLTRRNDYREYSSADQLISNGQAVVISTMRPRTYIKGIVPTAQAWPGYQPEMGQLEEGFAMEFSPLLGIDMQSADAVVKLRLNQVEKMLPVKLDMPTTVAPNQRVQVEVPQMTTANIHERFRWPTDKVLLLSMGVVATPDAGTGNALTDAMPTMFKSPPRADALLFVECRNNIVPATATVPGATGAAPAPRAATLPQSFHGRY